MLVFLPSCYRGRAEFYFKDGLKIKRTDWYLHLKSKELDDHIQIVVRAVGERDMGIGYELSMESGSPEHGLLIDSQLSEELYSLYWHAEIISELPPLYTIENVEFLEDNVS